MTDGLSRSPLARCVALTLTVRVGLCLLWPIPPSWDGHYYARLAAQLARGAGYAEPLAHGDIATASITVNSIPAVIDAAPGYRTMRDMRLPSFYNGKGRG